MSTVAQIEANRLNAMHSTGPRSVEGKTVSRFNSTKSGLYASPPVLPAEDPAEFEALSAGYLRTSQPVGPDEADLVDIIIQSSWTLRRLDRIETEILAELVSDTALPKDRALGAAF